MKVNYHVLNDSVVLNYDGKTFTVSRSDSRYAKVIEAIRSGQMDTIPEIVEIEKSFNVPGIEIRDGLVYDGDTPLPSQLSERILKFRDEGLPFGPLFKFWENLKKNPSFNSRQALFAFLEHNGHPLTEEGEFIAYRGLREDFKDRHTGKFDNSPGQVLEMPREQVDDNPNNTCSHGLHVACFDYAKEFASGGKLVEVKVNPADVVTVPTDYNGTKMRVCRFEVVREVESMNGDTLYGHKPIEDMPRDLPTHDEEADEAELRQKKIDDGKCPECDADIDPFDNYCKECGADLND